MVLVRPPTTDVYIKDPETREWHELEWELATDYPMAFSDEALKYTRRQVLKRDGSVDLNSALDEMLTRWNIHLGQTEPPRHVFCRPRRSFRTSAESLR